MAKKKKKKKKKKVHKRIEDSIEQNVLYKLAQLKESEAKKEEENIGFDSDGEGKK